MNRPNLFDFATSELSQDAVLCWLAKWADPQFATDKTMHELGLSFLRMCFDLHRKPFPERVESVCIKTQYKSIDVLVLVNEQYAILIEDKTFTSQHDNQLRRYQEVLKTDLAAYQPVYIYLKTGNQSDTSEVTNHGYEIIGREMLLSLLDAAVEAGSDSEILLSFHAYLAKLHADYCAFMVEPQGKEDWPWPAWEGFFTALQDQLHDGHWDYVANPSGGFMGFWWHFNPVEGGDIYLQLEGPKLCIKLAVAKREEAGVLRDLWHERLMVTARQAGVAVARPARLAQGSWMTIGVVEPYRQFSGGKLDMPATVRELHELEQLLDIVARSSWDLCR